MFTLLRLHLAFPCLLMILSQLLNANEDSKDVHWETVNVSTDGFGNGFWSGVIDFLGIDLCGQAKTTKTCPDFGKFIKDASKYKGSPFPGTLYSTCETDKDLNKVVCWIRFKNDDKTDLEVQFWLDGGLTYCRYAFHKGYYADNSW
uniref:Uncharacterized protein n=1 Tax=Cacopsylla melanoneura TaxID=428564 RepID=A0A8D8UFU3_9HEMI